MLQPVYLPQLGQTMEEGTIERWHKSTGDTVAKGDVFYELTTDKATLEVESFAEGTVLAILAEEGQTVPVNELIAVIGQEGDELPENLDSLRQGVKTEAQAAPAGEAEGAVAAPVQKAEEEAPAKTEGRRFASPRARKVAREKKAPLEVLNGTGPGGRIIERDVLAYVERLQSVRVTPTALAIAFEKGVDLTRLEPSEPGGRITREDVLAAPRAVAGKKGERIPLTAMRQTIARRMAEAKSTIPHFYLTGKVRMGRAKELREQLNASGKEVSLTALMVKATGLALQAHPRLNSRFDGEALMANEQVNVGVAVAVEDGLFVPVIRQAHSKEIGEISRELKRLAQTAREGKLLPEQYEGGSVTISNLGMFGVESFLPIINPPECCIIGLGEVCDEVVAKESEVAVEPVMRVSLSVDHRVVDGAEAARFFQTFRQILEDPEQL